MEMSHRELDLSIKQKLILRYISVFGISKENFYKNERLSFLREYQLIQNSRTNSDRFKISEKGSMLLRFRTRSFFRFWIPTIISFLALLASYNVYVSPHVQRLLESVLSVLKTILAK